MVTTKSPVARDAGFESAHFLLELLVWYSETGHTHLRRHCADV
jgi:hypothetical protein